MQRTRSSWDHRPAAAATAAATATSLSVHRHHSRSSSAASDLWFKNQKRGRHCRRAAAGVTALNMAGFWAKPSLGEVSVLDLPVLQQGSDSADSDSDGGGGGGGGDIAVVYFTACDLRTHDHDGLVAAAGAAGVVPVYVFDDQV